MSCDVVEESCDLLESLCTSTTMSNPNRDSWSTCVCVCVCVGVIPTPGKTTSIIMAVLENSDLSKPPQLQFGNFFGGLLYM